MDHTQDIELEKQRKRRVCELAMDAGAAQLCNGAEIWRVEDTMYHICASYDVGEIEVFVLSNGIFMTGNDDGETFFSVSKHIPMAGSNLGVITDVNSLSRKIENEKIDIEIARAELKKILKQKPKPLLFTSIATGIGSGCFGHMVGADVFESITGGIIACMIIMLMFFLDKMNIPKLIKNIFAGGVVALMAILATNISFFNCMEVDKIIISAIFPLLQGVSFVNAIRDLANADFISGAVKMLDTIMVFMYVAVGASTVLSAYYGLIGGAL